MMVDKPYFCWLLVAVLALAAWLGKDTFAMPESWPHLEQWTFRRPNQSELSKDELLEHCNMTFPSLQWGWDQACNYTKGGDETCEVFMASNLFYNETRFIETARRSTDPSYNPSLVRLESRLLEAVLEGRPATVVALGPSNTLGRGCPPQRLRWSDVLQNLSNFTGSLLPLRVINEARPATNIQSAWRPVLNAYKTNLTVDLIVIDYAVTGQDKSQSHKSAGLINTFVEGWERPPAILFLETFSLSDMAMISEGASACSCVREFEKFDPFYTVVKALKLPSLSYPDIACNLPPLNRSSKSLNRVPFLHAYADIRWNIQWHYGCGVHLILAHALHLYLNQLLQNSCGHCGNPEFCVPRFQSSLERLKLEANGTQMYELTPEDKCEMNIETNLEFDGSSLSTFAAKVSNSSNWHLGADRPGKFGWIANEDPAILARDSRGAKQHFDNLPATDIIFLLRMSIGTVFVDHLATYDNIGSATCQLEDINGKVISPALKIDALWSHRYSISHREKISASEVPKLNKGPNAALRCRDEGKKFKFIRISSC